MPQETIENPIINSAFLPPSKHFKFSDDGITNIIEDGRRPSAYFTPIARTRKKNDPQLSFDTEWTRDRIEENRFINQVRERIKPWRDGGYSGVTPTTARLLSYWNEPSRDKKLFFCQIEALETAIYITEVGRKFGDAWIENFIREANDSSNPGLPRQAFKMATGSGKTVVMAMLIAWQTLNKIANPQDARFTDTFLIITPGITIRDRLRVLLPNDPGNYYRQRDIIPTESLTLLCQSKIVITNYHALGLREKVAAGKITKQILADGGPAGAFTETPDQMVRRVCRELGNKKNIIILNDEAHHCYRRKPDAESLTDEDLLREVMNTVGKPGKLGEQVKCVVSVSMLTEGWDANTVTHVLGVRAFGTQLLCEQVVGRALRRMSYAADEQGFFAPEYAEVYGVPFSFIPCSGTTSEPKAGPMPTRVRALDNRKTCEIVFPRLLGYRYDISGEHLAATFTKDSLLALSTADLPTKTENAPIVGKSSIHTLDDLKRHRQSEVAFGIAKLTLEKFFRDDDGADKPWLFPQLLAITRRWLAECVTCKDNTFLQLLLLIEFAHDAADRIYKAIVQSDGGNPALKPILRPYDTLGSTAYVDFDTTRAVYSTVAAKCHISHVVADTDSWEQKLAQTLEDMPEVVRYVKNHNLGFAIPYTINGDEKNYIPDFIACINDGHGNDDLLNLIIEVSGEHRKDKAAKVTTARTLWIPAINNYGGFGRWGFIEIADPWNSAHAIRQSVQPAGE